MIGPLATVLVPLLAVLAFFILVLAVAIDSSRSRGRGQ